MKKINNGENNCLEPNILTWNHVIRIGKNTKKPRKMGLLPRKWDFASENGTDARVRKVESNPESRS